MRCGDGLDSRRQWTRAFELDELSRGQRARDRAARRQLPVHNSQDGVDVLSALDRSANISERRREIRSVTAG
jgi:hypothetical protein